MTTITKPQVIVEPYCANGTNGVDYIVPPQTGSSSVQSQDQGWPEIFAQPLSPVGSGLPVTRQQFNGVHNLYSSHDFWLQAGGTYTFEPTISTKYGGYPAGTVLWCDSLKCFVYSNINSNTNNFITTPANLGVSWIAVPISMSNTPILGHTPTSTIEASVDGTYTKATLYTTQGVSDEYAITYSNYTNAGDGVYKPTTAMFTTLTSGGYSAIIQNSANVSSNNYHGFQTELLNNISTNTYSRLVTYPDANNHPYLQLDLTDSAASETGIKLYNDGSTYMMPELIGSASTLGSTANSFVIKSQLPTSLTYTVGNWVMKATKLNNGGTDSTLSISGIVTIAAATSTGEISIDLNATVGWLASTLGVTASGAATFTGLNGNNSQTAYANVTSGSTFLNIFWQNNNPTYATTINFSIVV